MYDLDDLQVLFDTRLCKSIVRNILIKKDIQYEDHETYYTVNDSTTITFLHNKIIIIRKDISDINTFTITNVKHLEALSKLLDKN